MAPWLRETQIRHMRNWILRCGENLGSTLTARERADQHSEWHDVVLVSRKHGKFHVIGIESERSSIIHVDALISGLGVTHALTDDKGELSKRLTLGYSLPEPMTSAQPPRNDADADGGGPERNAKKQPRDDVRADGGGARKAAKKQPAAALPPPLPPLDASAKGLHFQLRCRCEWDHAGALGSKENDRGQKRYEDDDNVAYRDLVVAGTASGFDLVKALLCSFGLDTASERFEPASNQGALHLDDRAKGVYVHDVLRANDGGDGGRGTPLGAALISGLRYSKACANQVTLGELKRVRVAQLLDRPLGASRARAHEGARQELLLQLMLGPRVAHFSRRRGGVITPAVECWYTFHIQCEAVGRAAPRREGGDLESDLQRLLPRCVGGHGGCYGGNRVNWECGDAERDTPEGAAQVDEVNARFAAGRAGRGPHRFVFASGDPEEDFECVAKMQRLPMFWLELAESGAWEFTARHERFDMMLT